MHVDSVLSIAQVSLLLINFFLSVRIVINVHVHAMPFSSLFPIKCKHTSLSY